MRIIFSLHFPDPSCAFVRRRKMSSVWDKLLHPANIGYTLNFSMFAISAICFLKAILEQLTYALRVN